MTESGSAWRSNVKVKTDILFLQILGRKRKAWHESNRQSEKERANEMIEDFAEWRIGADPRYFKILFRKDETNMDDKGRTSYFSLV